MKVTAAAILCIAIFALTTSCGSSDATRGGGSTQSEARHRAESIVLARSDLPDGWKAAPYKQNTADAKKFRECITPATSDSAITAGADSIFFSDTQQASSGAIVFASPQQASTALRGMKSAAVATCFRDLFKKSVAGARVSVGKVRAGEVDVAAQPDVDETKGWHIATSSTLAPGPNAVKVTNLTDLVALQDGDAIVILSTDNGLFPVDPELRAKLLKELAGRLTSNQG